MGTYSSLYPGITVVVNALLSKESGPILVKMGLYLRIFLALLLILPRSALYLPVLVPRARERSRKR